MTSVSLLQIGSVFVLNIGFTWLVGSWLARQWIGPDATAHYAQLLRRCDLLAAGLTIAGSVLSLWAATAIMGDIGLADAVPMVRMMLTSTSYGHAGAMATAALTFVLLCRAAIVRNGLLEAITAAALLAHAGVRASMGHAGEEGWFSGTMLAETVHYVAIAVWTGVVAVSGWLVLRGGNAFGMPAQETGRYLDSMSIAATWALAAIVATGIYSAWHRVGSAEHMVQTTYGITLLVKLGLVAVAIALGGFNKLYGLPRAARSASGQAVVRKVLQAETFVLYGALAAAAALTSQQPPAAM